MTNILSIISKTAQGLLFFTFMSAQAQNIPLDPAVRTGRLSNGFTYYIRKNNEPQKRVQMYLANNVGSVLEDADQQGLAHFMEHMNFNGTKNFPKNELVDYLQKAGIRFGADLNAHTSFDETVYELPIPTDDPSMTANGLKIMRDWAQEATLDSVEIEKERGVVLEEERLGKGARDRMSRQTYPVLFNHSRYAERLPIGMDNVLTSFRPAVIKRFHDDWYRPDLQALIVVGDVNVKEVEKQIRAQFANLKNPVNERPRTMYKVPLTGRRQFLMVTDKEASSTDLEIIYKHKASPLVTVADYLKLMKTAILNQLLAARRFAEISQESKPAFINMSAGVQNLLGGIDMFGFDVTTKSKQLQQAFKQSWVMVEKVRRYGFTQTELDLAKQNYLMLMETRFKEKAKTASENFVKEYQRLFLQQEAAPGIDWEYAYVKNYLAGITLADISSLLTEYLQSADMDILLSAPEQDKNNLPDSATIVSWINNINKADVPIFKDVPVDRSLFNLKLRPGKVIDKKQIRKLNITMLTLDNGLKVVLKPTDFKNDEISFNGFSAGGTSLYDDKDYDDAANASGLMSHFGLGDLNPIELSKLLSGKAVSVSASIGPRSQTVTGNSTAGDLETALQLAYLEMTHPRKDTLLFRNTINNTKEKLAGRSAEPASVFADTINQVMGNYSYRSSPPSIAKLDNVSLQRAYDIYRERFADASGFTFVFVGNFTPEGITPLLEKYLGSLPSSHLKVQARDLGIHIPPGKITKKVYRGSENKAVVRLLISGDYQYNAMNNLLLKAVNDILQIKILQHLREDESEVYSPAIQTVHNKFPQNRYAINVTFGCAPKNADHLIGMVEKEMAALRNTGPELDDIRKFKMSYEKSAELALKDNGFWLNYLSSAYENKDDISESLQTEEELARVTPQAIQEAAKIFLKGDNMIRFELLPENE